MARRKLSKEAYDKLYNIDWLKEQYITNNRTISSIANELDCHEMKISKVMKENGIRVGKTKNPEVLKYLEDREWIENEYFINNNTVSGIAKIIGVSNCVVHKYFKLYNIPVSHTKLKDRPFTTEHKQRISIGKKNYVFTPEHLANMKVAAFKRRGLPGPTKGIPCPLERRLRISAKEKGTKIGLENPFYGKHHTLETKKFLSEIAKNREVSPMLGKHHTPETKEKMSKIANSPEARAKRKAYYERPDIKEFRSTIMKKRYIDGYCIHGRGEWITFDTKTVYLRSSYERRVVNVLENLGLQWEYESKSFDLGNSTYRPDFYLPDLGVWWEVKGWLNDDNKRKMETFFSLYPDICLRMIWLEDIEKLETFPNNIDVYDLIELGKDNVNCDKNGNYGCV